MCIYGLIMPKGWTQSSPKHMKVGVQGQGPQTSSSLYITQMLHYRQQIITRVVMYKAYVTPRSGYKVINKSYSHSHYLGRDIL